METLRQIGGSIMLAIFSAALVIGGISLALAESYVPEIPPTATITPTLAPIFNSPTTQPQIAFTSTVTTPSATVPPPTSCPPPSGWIAVTVKPGETLLTLAQQYQSTPTNLSVANCLFSNSLPTGAIIYVPPVPTKTAIPCGPPSNWIQYIVQPGNTMYSLSQAYGVTIAQLQFANCMSASQYNLGAGQRIWVPNVATRTPRATATATSTPIIIVFPTLTRTATVTATPTDVATSTATATKVPTFTPTATVPSPTTPPTATPTITRFPTSTATNTPVP
jgi:LysM repeat protein